MAAPANDTGVELGFAEKVDGWRLVNHFFPSKIGGEPSWLSLDPLPTIDLLQCKHCANPCVFFLQIYAPVESDPRCFHRTIFMFVCLDPKCCKINNNGNFQVVRSQLGKINNFYSAEAPETEQRPESTEMKVPLSPLCFVCGAAGPKQCARCKRAHYCSKLHQTIHWKAGHKAVCNASEGSSQKTVEETVAKILFPEFEVVTEPEELLESQVEEKSEAEKLEEYKKFMSSGEASNLLVNPKLDKDLNSMAGTQAVDKQFEKFKKRVEADPDQVMRYERGGLPLWLSKTHMPAESDIPSCDCGAKRQFEFQVMPQMLNHLGVDSTSESLDWGTLAVYTCAQNCNIGNKYSQEFVWKQDILSDS